MNAIGNFCSGLTMGHVDWNTRHNSRAYAAGINTSCVVLILTPFAICFTIGFVAGRLSQ